MFLKEVVIVVAAYLWVDGAVAGRRHRVKMMRLLLLLLLIVVVVWLRSSIVVCWR